MSVKGASGLHAKPRTQPSPLVATPPHTFVFDRKVQRIHFMKKRSLITINSIKPNSLIQKVRESTLPYYNVRNITSKTCQTWHVGLLHYFVCD